VNKAPVELIGRKIGLSVLTVSLLVQLGFAQPRTSRTTPSLVNAVQEVLPIGEAGGRQARSFPLVIQPDAEAVFLSVNCHSDQAVRLPVEVRRPSFSSESTHLHFFDSWDQPYTLDLVARRLQSCGVGTVITNVVVRSAAPKSESSPIIWADKEGTVRLLEAHGGGVRTFRGHFGQGVAIALSADGRLLISGGGTDCTLRLWNVETESEICQLRVHGKRLDEIIEDLGRESSSAGRGGVSGLCLSPNGQFLVTAGHDDLVCVRELRTLEVLQSFAGPSKTWPGLLWSPSSEYLAFYLNDGGLIIHNVYAHLKQNAPVPRVLKRIGGYQDFWSRSSPNPTNEIVPANAVDVEWEDSWDALTGNAPLAYRTMERMIDAPAKATSFLRSKIEIPSVVSKETLRQWFVDLNDNSYRVRVRAMRELAQSASANPTVLRAELSSELTVEARNRIEELLRQRERFIPTPERLRLFRVIYLLERINTPESQAMLRQFAALPKDDEFAQAANRALKRCDFAK